MFSNLFLSVILSTIENYKHVGLLHIKYNQNNIFFYFKKWGHTKDLPHMECSMKVYTMVFP